MGMLFSAFLRCDVSDVNDARIRTLEAASPWEAQEVARLRRTAYSGVVLGPGGWIRVDDVFPVPISRPQSLSSHVALRTDEDFYFHFGNQTVQLVHSLDLGRFLRNQRWRRPLISACLTYAQILAARDGVITSDDGSLALAFEQGRTFDEILAAGKGKDDEVERIDDLLELWDDGVTWDSHGYWYFLRDGRPVPIDNNNTSSPG